MEMKLEDMKTIMEKLEPVPQPEWDGISYPSFIPFREKGAEKAIQDIMGFKSRESDILLATHCKSGNNQHKYYNI